MAKRKTKKTSKKDNTENTNDDVYFSKRTIADMAHKGIGHSKLKSVLDNLNKKK